MDKGQVLRVNKIKDLVYELMSGTKSKERQKGQEPKSEKKTKG